VVNRVAFAVPGDLATPTGGYAYDRRIIAELQKMGWQVDVVNLGDGFPKPTWETKAAAKRKLAEVPKGCPIVIDGLAFGVMDEAARELRDRNPLIALVHHPLALETGLDDAQRDRLFHSERQALAAARMVIVTSAATARALAAYDVPAGRIHVVEPGTDAAALRARPRGPELTLLCVATLTPRKGHAVLVEALAGLQDRPWTLHCVGSASRDPATAQALHTLLAARGLQARVQLHGEVDAATLEGLYAQADAFVLPSFHEGYGMALAEALAHGLPVLSTTAGAIPDTVPAEAGVLLPPGDAAALRQALARLMDDAPWRAALAAGARAARLRLPTWAQAVARFATALVTVALQSEHP